MEKKHIILGVGEILWDMLPEGKQLGGAPTNFAYHACQLGGNGYVASSVGGDSLGREIMNIINKNRMGNLIAIDSIHPTGTVEVTLTDRGIPTYNIIENVAWDYIPVIRKTLDLVGNADAICFGSLAQRNTVSRNSIHEILKVAPVNCLKVFDINLRQQFYTEEIIKQSLELSNVLKINNEELTLLQPFFDLPVDQEKACHTLIRKFDLRLVALTRGENGSYLINSRETSYEETPRVDIEDTVGAGDSFTAAMVVGLLKNKPLKDVHKDAVKLSAFVCTQKGATPEIPAGFID